ncbi:uncharacterized protein B0P05DRAFT_526139 [Gilbertella persicaria]|uniref:uncharacterized protein n=1 Tax=Gilbertella persicaria TaxID=101096 RepID=UPI00221F0550|nr:uncharacterized protein B0P05DRAFT_526139 [Gilbertella persicaria]KAI8092408.1 hypothetical protein B0P05DRAFT_526139 [Gilbertella persicaria]
MHGFVLFLMQMFLIYTYQVINSRPWQYLCSLAFFFSSMIKTCIDTPKIAQVVILILDTWTKKSHKKLLQCLY